MRPLEVDGRPSTVTLIRTYAERLAWHRYSETLLYGWPYDRARYVASGKWKRRFGDAPCNGYFPLTCTFSLDAEPDTVNSLVVQGEGL